MPFRVRDPIHNFIELPDELAAIVDAPVLQRLRGIRQLAMAESRKEGRHAAELEGTDSADHPGGVQEGEVMTPYDFVHLVIHAAGDKVGGRTKLQKLVYFVGALTGFLPKLGYRAHYYGPYSPAVAGAVQELRGLKFLEQHISPMGLVDPKGFEVTRYDYSLTAEGKEIADDKANARPEEWKRIAEATKKVCSAKVQDYVRLAIAAKTHLIHQSAGERLSGDNLKKKAEEHGWKAFSSSDYDEALKFLKFVGLDRLEK